MLSYTGLRFSSGYQDKQCFLFEKAIYFSKLLSTCSHRTEREGADERMAEKNVARVSNAQDRPGDPSCTPLRNI